MRRVALAALAVLLACAGAARAEHIKLGALKTAGAGPMFIAIERGYFTAEGLDAEMVYFEAAQPAAVAAASGDIDFGVTGLTAGFYNLASHGVLRIIGAQGREAQGFHNVLFLASKQAYAGGLTSLRGLGGHSAAITQTGTPGHYAIGLAAEKYDIPLASIRILTLQSVPNIVSALTGGQADVGATVITMAMVPAIDRGDLHVLAWVSDEFPFQDRAIFVSTKTANERRDLIERFFRAFRKGAQDYHDAFIGPGERPHDGPGAAAILALIGKYTGQPPEAVKLGIAYVDPSLKVDVTDVARQIAWFKAQGMVKSDVTAADILDRRYVLPLPGEEMP